MDVGAVLLFLAALNERLIQLLFAPWFDKIEKLKPYKWCLIYPQVVTGMLLGWLTGLMGLNLFVMIFPKSNMPIFWASLMVGAVVGAGSELVHFVLNLINPKTNGMATKAATSAAVLESAAAVYIPPTGSMPNLTHRAGEHVTTEELRGVG